MLRALLLSGLLLCGSALSGVEVNLQLPPPGVTEGESITLTATRDGTSGPLSVPVFLVGAPGYAHLSDPAFAFANGASQATIILSVDDDLIANGGTRAVSAQIDLSGGVTSRLPAVTVGVRDDDVAISLQAVDVLAAEGGAPIDAGRIRIVVGGVARTDPITVQFEIDGSARFEGTGTNDYALSRTVGGSTAAIPPEDGVQLVNVELQPGDSEVVVDLTPVNDNAVEGSETCEIRLSTASLAYIVSGGDRLPITLADDDNRITSLTGTPAYESGADGNIRIVFLSSFSSAKQVPYQISGVANDGSEFTLLTGTAALAAGEDDLAIAVDALWDDESEGHTLTFTLLSSPDYVLPGTPTITIPIVDCVGTASIAKPIAAIESMAGSPLSFAITVDRYAGFADAVVLVAFRLAGGTAGSGEYSVGGAGVTYDAGSATGVIAIPGGSSTANIECTPVDDSLADGDKTVTITLVSAESVLIDADADDATGIIADDEPTISIERTGSEQLAEGGPACEFTISYPGVPDGVARTHNVEVRFTIGGSALVAERTIAGAGVEVDGTGLAGVATIPAHQRSVVVTVVAEDDEAAEAAETVVLTLAPPVGPASYRLSEEATASVEVVDPDGRPTVSIEGVADAIEGRTVQCFRVTRTGATTAPLTVQLDDASGTASAGDYQALPSTVVLPSGADEVLVPVTAISDGADPDETLVLSIASDDAYLIGDASASVTIVSGFADNQFRIGSEPADPVLLVDDGWTATCRLALPAGVPAGRTEAVLAAVPSGAAVPGWISVARTSVDTDTGTSVFTLTASPPIGTAGGPLQVRVRVQVDVDGDGTRELELDQDLLLWVQAAGGAG